MGNKNKPKMITVQVIRGWNEGRVLQVGDRIEVHPRRARIMEQLGYAIRINPDDPYTHPAAKKEHQFQEVDFDGDEPVKEPIADKPGPDPVVEPEPKGVEVTIPSLDDLTFTNKSHVAKLKKSGIHVIPDIEGWDINGLSMINGISRKTATKLMDAYNHYCNLDHNKDSDLEVKTK